LTPTINPSRIPGITGAKAIEMTITTTETLNEITRAEAEAEAAAAKAQAAAEAARVKADHARERAEVERARAYKSYLDLLTKEYPEARAAAMTEVGESHAALEQAVRDGGDIFGTYLKWVSARVQAWEVDSELAQIRHHHGVSVRSTDPPVFRFDIDLSAIIDQIAGEFQDDAVQRITDRRSAYVNGRTA
jgi:acyl-CoA reductase-like NAD-dependent aldehyde dehydrogenase